MPGYVFPNETEIQWSLLIVLYPYITGLVAGAFVVSSLYHVFNVKALKPVASMSLIAALSFLLVAPMALQAHLGHPERAFEIFLTPNRTSAMAGFGYIWAFYTLLVVAEVWLVFRPDIVYYAGSSSGLKKRLYWLAALGVLRVTPRGRHADERLIKILATAGIPAACVLHGYVGFLFGAIKANPWWSTPLMPVIFLMSAIVSGIAMLVVMYVAVSLLRGKPIDHECIRSLARWLLGFLIIDLAMEGLELLNMFYEAEDTWPVISGLITERLLISFVGIQVLLGGFVPLATLLVLAIPGPLPGKGWLYTFREVTATRLTVAAALLVLIGVFAMRWNVVIGGQMVSKSLRGYLNYVPPLGGREGVLAVLVFFSLPFYIFYILTTLIPPWDRPALDELEHEPGERGRAPDLVPAPAPGLIRPVAAAPRELE